MRLQGKAFEELQQLREAGRRRAARAGFLLVLRADRITTETQVRYAAVLRGALHARLHVRGDDALTWYDVLDILRHVRKKTDDAQVWSFVTLDAVMSLSIHHDEHNRGLHTSYLNDSYDSPQFLHILGAGMPNESTRQFHGLVRLDWLNRQAWFAVGWWHEREELWDHRGRFNFGDFFAYRKSAELSARIARNDIDGAIDVVTSMITPRGGSRPPPIISWDPEPPSRQAVLSVGDSRRDPPGEEMDGRLPSFFRDRTPGFVEHRRRCEWKPGVEIPECLLGRSDQKLMSEPFQWATDVAHALNCFHTIRGQ